MLQQRRGTPTQTNLKIMNAIYTKKPNKKIQTPRTRKHFLHTCGMCVDGSSRSKWPIKMLPKKIPKPVIFSISPASFAITYLYTANSAFNELCLRHFSGTQVVSIFGGVEKPPNWSSFKEMPKTVIFSISPTSLVFMELYTVQSVCNELCLRRFSGAQAVCIFGGSAKATKLKFAVYVEPNNLNNWTSPVPSKKRWSFWGIFSKRSCQKKLFL